MTTLPSKRNPFGDERQFGYGVGSILALIGAYLIWRRSQSAVGATLLSVGVSLVGAWCCLSARTGLPEPLVVADCRWSVVRQHSGCSRFCVFHRGNSDWCREAVNRLGSTWSPAVPWNELLGAVF